jgi:pyridoxamine 5'-phosphate oxidase family protein
MSVFTGKEREYLAVQRLGRIATVGPDGQPHVVPTSFRYDAGTTRSTWAACG